MRVSDSNFVRKHIDGAWIRVLREIPLIFWLGVLTGLTIFFLVWGVTAHNGPAVVVGPILFAPSLMATLFLVTYMNDHGRWK